MTDINFPKIDYNSHIQNFLSGKQHFSMPAFTDSLLQLILLTLCVSISRADDLTDDGLDSKLEVMKEHLSPSLRGDGTSAPATVPEGGSERAIVILSWLIVSVGMIVVTFFFWTLKTQIKEFIVKVSKSSCPVDLGAAFLMANHQS